MRPLQIAGVALVLLGVASYLAFGLAQGSPFDRGPYSLFIVPAGFGAAVWMIGRES